MQEAKNRICRMSMGRVDCEKQQACMKLPASVAGLNSTGDSAVGKNALKNWGTGLRGPSVVVVFAYIFLPFLYNAYVY